MNEVRQYIASRLSPVYSSDELNALIWWILEELTSKNRAILLTSGQISDISDLQPRLDNVISRLLKHEPVQYIFGHTEWCGLDLIVTPAVLIPRPETAGIVSYMQHNVAGLSQMKILDVGTGSGCLAIALKRLYPHAHVTALDISQEALDIALRNAKLNNLDVNFIHSDILNIEPHCEWANMKYDVIVSNPPYIAESESETMENNVLDYEPSHALFVPDNDPLLFYRETARFASSRLNPGGVVMFEINRRFGSQTVQLMKSELSETEVLLLQDDYGNDRFVVCRNR